MPLGTAAWMRTVLSALLAGIVLAGAFALLTPLRGGGSAHYVVTQGAVLAVFAAAAAATLAAGSVRWGTLGGYAAAGVAAGALVFAGMLLIFSLGLPLLFAGAVVLMLAALASRRRGWGALCQVLCGGALAFALGVVLYIAVLRPPVVACGPGGSVGTSSPSWSGGGSVLSGAGGSRERTSGTIRQGEVTISFTCEDGRLTELRTDRQPGIP